MRIIVIALLLVFIGSAVSAASLTVQYYDGSTTTTGGSQSGKGAYHFDVYHHGAKVTDATATVDGKDYKWGGQGSENADLSAFDEGFWHWVLSTIASILTISNSEGTNTNGEPPVNGDPPNGDDPNPPNGNGTPPNGDKPGNGGTPGTDWGQPETPMNPEAHARVLERRALPQTGGGAWYVLASVLLATGLLLRRR